MDYKQRLQELAAQEAAKNQAEEHRKKSFEGQQRASFATIRTPILEIIEAAGPTVSRNTVGEAYATLTIAGSGSSEVVYDVEPNSRGKFSSSPSPAPGFVVKKETRYNNGPMYIEPTRREYVLNDADALLEDLMKYVAEAMAKK